LPGDLLAAAFALDELLLGVEAAQSFVDEHHGLAGLSPPPPGPTPPRSSPAGRPSRPCSAGSPTTIRSTPSFAITRSTASVACPVL
jgi:hypothetical protein